MRAHGQRMVVGLAVALGACGTTHIRTTDPGARIWVDGELVGRGAADIQRRGLPHTARIVVVASDGRRVTREVSRSFTLTTLLAGLITCYVGLATVWELPESLTIELPARGGWDDDGRAWLEPAGWARTR